MAKYFRIFIFVIASFLSTTSHAQNIFIKKPDLSRTILSSEQIDDIRIFDYSSAKSFWYLKKGNLRITTLYEKGALSSIDIKRFEKQKVISAYYQQIKGRLLLVSAEIRPIRVFNADETSPVALPASDASATSPGVCTTHSEAIQELADANLAIQNASLTKTSEEVAASCSPKAKGFLAAAIRKSVEVKPPDKETSLSSCLNEADKASNFEKAGIKKDFRAQVSAKLDLQSAKIYANSPDLNSSITCKPTLPSGKKALTTEDGKMTFSEEYIGSNISTARIIFSEELLHQAGVTDEDDAHAIAKYCVNQIPPKEKSAVSSLNKSERGGGIDQVVSAADATADTATKNVANSTPATISPELASRIPASINPTISDDSKSPSIASVNSNNNPNNSESSYSGNSSKNFYVPSQDGLSSIASANTYIPESVDHAVETSQQQSSSLTNFATAITSAMMAGTFKAPVLAATVSTSAVAATGSTYQAPVMMAQPSSASSSRSAVAAAANTRGSKDIDLNAIANGSNAAAEIANGPNAPSSESSSTGGGSRAVAARSGTRSGDMDSTGTNSAPSSGSSSSRQPANVNSTYTPSADEITTFFVRNENYQFAKKRLGESKMQSDLEEANVSITNLQNQHFGAPEKKADTVILDNGRAFVVKKQK